MTTVKSVEFLSDHNNVFKKGDRIDFRPGLNLLVGDQGCGKSTLIELLRVALGKKRVGGLSESDSSWRAINHSSEKKIDEIIRVERVDTDTPCQLFAFDFERESPRDKAMMLYDMIDLQMAGMRSSHGQSNQLALNRVLSLLCKANGLDINKQEEREKLKLLDLKNTVMLLDEPDGNMSIRSCVNLTAILKRLASQGAQVIASVHNMAVIDSVKEVLSLEHGKRWITSNEFVLNHLGQRS